MMSDDATAIDPRRTVDVTKRLVSRVKLLNLYLVEVLAETAWRPESMTETRLLETLDAIGMDVRILDSVLSQWQPAGRAPLNG